MGCEMPLAVVREVGLRPLASVRGQAPRKCIKIICTFQDKGPQRRSLRTSLVSRRRCSALRFLPHAAALFSLQQAAAT